MAKRKKHTGKISKFRITMVDVKGIGKHGKGAVYMQYSDSPAVAANFLRETKNLNIKYGVTGKISMRNPKTGRFKKFKKIGW